LDRKALVDCLPRPAPEPGPGGRAAPSSAAMMAAMRGWRRCGPGWRTQCRPPSAGQAKAVDDQDAGAAAFAEHRQQGQASGISSYRPLPEKEKMATI